MNVLSAYIQRLVPARPHTSTQRGGFGGCNPKSLLPFKPDTIQTLAEVINLHAVGLTMNECAETARFRIHGQYLSVCPNFPDTLLAF
jgi:hypothetical protein